MRKYLTAAHDGQQGGVAMVRQGMKCNTKPREIHTVVDLLQSNNSLWG